MLHLVKGRCNVRRAEDQRQTPPIGKKDHLANDSSNVVATEAMPKTKSCNSTAPQGCAQQRLLPTHAQARAVWVVDDGDHLKAPLLKHWEAMSHWVTPGQYYLIQVCALASGDAAVA